MILAEYTFGQGLLTVLSIFVFAAWLMVLFTVLGDLFRDHELSGWYKAIWALVLIFAPFLGTLIYLLARGNGMRERALAQQAEMREQLMQSGAGSTADELAKVAKLHDAGKLSDAEFETAKARIVG